MSADYSGHLGAERAGCSQVRVKNRLMRLSPFFVLFFLGGCASIQGSLFDMGVASERAQSGLERHTVEIGGHRVHYLERRGEGPDTQTLVLIHGFAGDKNHWIRFVRFLPPGYRVLAPDLPAHGDNVLDPTVTYSITYLTDALSAFVDALEEGPVHLVGNSLGGRIATELALAHPERVRTVSLLDPAGLASPEPSALDVALARGENLLIPTTREEYDTLISISFGEDTPELAWPAPDVLARRYANRASVYRKIWADLGTAPNDLDSRLHQLARPLLVVWGEQDGVIDVSAAGRWAGHVPQAEIKIMAGVGHAPMLERPEETAKLVDAFIKRAHQ